MYPESEGGWDSPPEEHCAEAMYAEAAEGLDDDMLDDDSDEGAAA